MVGLVSRRVTTSMLMVYIHVGYNTMLVANNFNVL